MAHHCSLMIVSPLLAGNRVFGGIDPKTCETYGFDGTTGEADPSLKCSEGHIYSAIAQALDIEFPGRLDMSAVLATDSWGWQALDRRGDCRPRGCVLLCRP